MLSWKSILVAFGIFVAINVLIKMCYARSRDLKSKLDGWLNQEIETVTSKRRLFETVRKKRAQLKAEREATAAAAAAQIAELGIAEKMSTKG